ncbi:MAG: hypothetical protein JNJ73_01595 [Hyphomonadaceae bacterium]|nr:hypothetical protein [Hyphomonadaceae bacterium]
MANLEATIARLRALPATEQDAAAAQIDLLLEAGEDDILTPEQWAEIEARLDAPESFTLHEDVVREFREKFR